MKLAFDVWCKTAWLCAVTTLFGLAAARPADAGARKHAAKHLAAIAAIETPESTERRDPAVLVRFTLVQAEHRLTKVDFEVGYDRNGDGVIADGSQTGLPSEYRPCTHQRQDDRDTGSARGPVRRGAKKSSRIPRFRAGADAGTLHAFSWNATADLPNAMLLAEPSERLTEFGWPMYDFDISSEPLQTSGETGVRLRVRTRAGAGHKRVYSPWSYTDRFSVRNNEAPRLSIDSLTVGDVVSVRWTVSDPDTEDTNGNGYLDKRLGEDRDGDGMLDLTQASVWFEFLELPTDDPETPEDESQRPAGDWMSCAPGFAFGLGDGSLHMLSTAAGRSYSFVWNSNMDAAPPGGRVLFRAFAFDGQERSEPVVWPDPIQLPDLAPFE